MNATLQGRVQQVIDGLVESGDEIGLQVAAYVNGELVVDTWSGVADEDTGQLVDGDTLQTDAPDVRFGERSRRALGYSLGGEMEQGGDISMGRGGSEFGHAGNGGSLGFADPVRKLSFGLIKNRMRWPEPTEDPAYLVAETIRAYLEETTA